MRSRKEIEKEVNERIDEISTSEGVSNILLDSCLEILLDIRDLLKPEITGVEINYSKELVEPGYIFLTDPNKPTK